MIRTCQYCREDFDSLRRSRTCPACKARIDAGSHRMRRELARETQTAEPVGSCGAPESTIEEKRERLAERSSEVIRRARYYARRCCPMCGHTLAEDPRDPGWLRCQRPECGHLASPEALRAARGDAPPPASLPGKYLCTKCGAPRLHGHVPTAAAGLGLCRECARPYRQARAAKNLPLRPCALCDQPTRAKDGYCRACREMRLEVVV